MISSHVKISMISLITSLSLKLYLNSLAYHRNIFGSSSKVFGNLWQSSEIFGNSRKIFGNFRLVFGTIFENLRKVVGNLRKIIKKRRHQYVYIIKWCGQTICLLATLLLGYTLRVRMTSYQLPWQRTRSTKCPLNFSFCKLSEKLIRRPTIFIYLFVGKFPKLFNFSDGKEKRYLVELNIFKENAFYGLQKILLDNFSPKLLYLKCHREWYVYAKNQDRSRS